MPWSSGYVSGLPPRGGFEYSPSAFDRGTKIAKHIHEQLVVQNTESMMGENRQLVTNEPVDFEK